MVVDRAETWVQPVVVDRAGTHLATIRSAALASVLCWRAQSALAEWDSWLAGPFTKSVRRAKPTQVEALAALPGALVVRSPEGAGTAVGFPPVRYDELPREISRLQVSGTDLPREEHGDEHDLVHDERSPLTLAVRDDLTTGKAAAQAAHALFAWALTADADVLAAWEEAPLVPVRLVQPALLERLAVSAGAVPIRDSGLTEVEPDTLTAVAVPR